jgi:cytochrome c oxidase subunit 2
MTNLRHSQPERMKRGRRFLAGIALAMLFVVSSISQAQTPAAQSALISDVRFDQRLNQQVPLDLTFRDERGKEVQLGSYFGKKPVVLSLVYYSCPMLCTLVLNGLTETLIEQKFNVGDEFNVVTISFDPHETSALAQAKKNTYLRRYGRPGAADGWHFLTGDEGNIEKLTQAVGFHYHFDPATGQFAHPSGILILTPQGKIARYFYGIDYPARDFRFGLIEASQEKIGSPVDQVLLLCYHYDPKSGKYNSIAMGSVRVGGGLTLVGLGALFVVLWRGGRRRKLISNSSDDRTFSCLLPLLLIPLFPTAASTEAQNVDSLFLFLLGLCGFVALLIVCLILYFAIKYRRKSEDQLALWSGTVSWMEWSWTFVPLVIFIGIFLWGVKLFFAAVRPPADAIEINVVAKQWMWKFQHPEGQREINELHVPVGRQVRLNVISQDVIHSLFVPDFRLHRDVLPNRYLTAWFEATTPGRYHLFCSQYCGTQHSGMIGYVIVMEPADYQRWLTGGGEGSLASQGQKLFRQLSCNSCHTGDSTARGPELDGLYGTIVDLQDGTRVLADDTYIRESIVTPRKKVVAGFQPIMPTFQNQLDEEQILELIAYLKSLGPQRQEVPPVSAPEGPQPSPVQGAIKSSETRKP